jgi:mannose-6-phosphate isomerase-like protein (cupin superfamily)
LTDTIAVGSGTTVRIVAAREEATLLELALEPGAGAGPHMHTKEDETIAVLDGRLVVDDGRRHELGPGDAIVLPRRVRHSFANEGGEVGRAHVFCSPGGLERFFRDVAAATSDADVAAAAERAGLVFG